jgi:molybdopterin/thiamine biosynthesis adenylyltransferase
MTIAPDLECDTLCAMITLEPVARALSSHDLIFGCTDDNAGRLVLSRLATYFLTPVIDIGVLLSSGEGGQLTGIDGRVTILSPGSACLVCRDRVDLARAAAELKTPEERKRLEDEGYAPALGGTEPAVVAFTTMVAAMAVNELLERLIGYGIDARPSEVLLRLHDREISGNCAQPRDSHYCNSSQGKWGAGEEQPFLGQLWPT